MNAIADSLLAQVAMGARDDGTAANALLSEFYGGYPVEKLLPLLQSANHEVARSATWIAWELGERALPLAPALTRLLDHPYCGVRFYAVLAIHNLGSAAPAEATARAALAFRDPDPGVRSRGMDFLARLRADRLAASAPHWEGKPGGEHITWLIDCDRIGNAEAIVESLGSGDRDRRLVAAAAAARLAPEGRGTLRNAAQLARRDPRALHQAATAARLASQDRRALHRAAESADDEVASFARHWLASLRRDDEFLAKRLAKHGF